MTAVAKPTVIDASVALAWILPDENISPEVNELYQRFAAGKINLIAPQLLFYEVLNGIRSAVIQHRLDQNLAVKAIQQFNQLGIHLQVEQDGTDIVNLAVKLNLSVYDAAYIILTNKLKATLYTSDQKLFKAIGSVANIKLLGKS